MRDCRGFDVDGHGTHVAGIIAAERNNNLGVKGVADNVKIMAVRTVPDGDEYDKDVALAIRYAADNGAKIITFYLKIHPKITLKYLDKYTIENVSNYLISVWIIKCS